MSASIVKKILTDDWVDITGAAASVAGVTWQNVGNADACIAFTAAKPTATDSFLVLSPNQAWYDKKGSAKVWAMNRTIGRNTTLCATSD